MAPKQSAAAKAAAAPANGKPSKTAFLPPQRSTGGGKDPQSTEVIKPVNQDGGQSGRPDKTAYEREQAEIKVEIDALQAKLADIRGQISGGKSGGGPLGDRRKELRDELEALREAQSKNKSSRGQLLDKIKATQESQQRKIKELNAARGKLPYKSTAEVDAKIRQLESAVESGSMKLVDEKKALAEIQALKKQRKHVDAFGPQQDSIEADRATVEELRKTLDDPENKAANARWTAVKEELDEISAKMAEQGQGRDKLFDQRNELQKKLDEAYGNKRDGASKYKDANDKFYAKMQEDRQRRIERQRSERDAFESSKRIEENARLREEASAPAYEREIEDCRTLIGYFDKLTGSTVSSLEEPKLSNGTGSSSLPKLGEKRQVDGEDAFKGMMAVKKKGVEEEDFFAGSGGKKGKKGKKGPSPAAAGETPAPATQALQLPLSTLSALLALAVPTPMTRDDIPGTITALSEKRKWYTENQDRVTKERVANVEKKIAAAEKKTKTDVSGDASPAEGTDGAKTPINALNEVRSKLGDAATTDKEGVVVEKAVVDEEANAVVPPAEQA